MRRRKEESVSVGERRRTREKADDDESSRDAETGARTG
jgi:hypothetical protein